MEMKRISRMLFNKLYKEDIFGYIEKRFQPTVEKYFNNRNAKLLDAACGFNNPYLQKALISNSIGLDLDPNVKQRNKIHQHFVIQDLHDIEFRNEFDNVISVYTWEHLRSPEIVLTKIFEAIRKNGIFIIIAPNRYYYVSVIERLLSANLKDKAWKLLKGHSHMPYPAYFNLCTRSRLVSEAEKNGFKFEFYQAIEGPPIWFAKIPPLFLLACVWMSIVNRIDCLQNIRSTFIVVFRKE